MKKLYCVVCGKCRKFKNPKTSYTYGKTLVFRIIYSKCENENEKNIYRRRVNGDIKNSWFI